MQTRMSTLAKGLAAVALLALGACSSSGSYKQPGEAEPYASMSVRNRVTSVNGFSSIHLIPSMIDGKRMDPGMFSSAYRIAPGAHTLGIQLEINKYEDMNVMGVSMPDIAVYETYVELPVTLAAGKAYRPMVTAAGQQVEVWVETEQGERVTETVASGYRPMRMATPMPIFIPSK